MTPEAKQICDLIEKVDADDNDTLHEIDGRVGCYLSKFDYRDRHKSIASLLPTWNFKHFTHSRDALKAIRPEGWEWQSERHEDGTYTFTMDFDTPNTEEALGGFITYCFIAPTEELAELHAIIQSIDYERSSTHD